MSRHHQHQPECSNHRCVCGQNARESQLQRPSHSTNVMAVTALLNHDSPTPRHGCQGTTVQVSNNQTQQASRRHNSICGSGASLPKQTASNGGARRDSRPDYTEEEAMYVWYHRIDLNWGWDDLLRHFNHRFNATRDKPGLQCKFYRTLERNGMSNGEQVREQIRSSGGNSEVRRRQYGLIARRAERYPWMVPADLVKQPRAELVKQPPI